MAEDAHALLHHACEGEIGACERLLAGGVSVNAAPSSNGLTALHLCAHHGAKDAARFLIEQGADVDCVDAAGYTPLLSAAANGHDQIVAILIERGAAHTHRVRECPRRRPLTHSQHTGTETVLAGLWPELRRAARGAAQGAGRRRGLTRGSSRTRGRRSAT